MTPCVPQLANSDAEITACFPVIQALRPHLQADQFVATVRLQQQEGYQLAYLSNGKQPVACAGFRITNNLSAGKTLYVDDLVTSESERSAGYGARLLDWLRQTAKAENCSLLHLDSGVQRYAAHKFYFRNDMKIVFYHFAEALVPE